MTESELSFVTCQAENTVDVSREVAGYLTRRLGRPIRFRSDIDWRDAYRGIAAGALDIGWICGRPYVQLVDAEHAPIRLLVAPVMAGEQYGGRPVYYSDVIVRRDSPYHSFADLEGASWAYNEPGSQSGYHITRYRLARMGRGNGFFGRVVAAGSHRRSLSLVLDGEIDGAAIDTTVLEWVLDREPEIADRIRVIDTLGPSPIPPLVVSRAVPLSLFERLREELTSLHSHAEGRRILGVGGLASFVAVEDADYDPIRRMEAASTGVVL